MLNKKKVYETFKNFIVLVYLIHKIMPVIGFSMPTILYVVSMTLVSVMLIPSVLKGKESKAILKILPIFIFFAFELVSYFVGNNNTNMLSFLYSNYQVFLYGIIAMHYTLSEEPKNLRLIFIGVAIAYVITAITTYVGCLQIPQAARYITANATLSDENTNIYYKKNIGSFNFIYEISLITPCLIYLFKEKRHYRFLSCIMLVLSFLVVWKAEYTTALSCVIVTVLLIFIKNVSKNKLIFFVLLITVVSVSNIKNVSNMLSNIGKNVDSDVYSSRLQYVSKTLQGDKNFDKTESGDRFLRYQTSMETFIKTDFLGTFFSSNKNKGSGGHSFILDKLALNGIIGLLGLFYFYKSIYILIVKPYRETKLYPYFLWDYFLVIILMLLNPKDYLFVLIFILPVFGKIMEPGVDIWEVNCEEHLVRK